MPLSGDVMCQTGNTGKESGEARIAGPFTELTKPASAPYACC
jgi:hypothetical protein